MSCFDVRWKGQRLAPTATKGEWSFSTYYAEHLAAHWWNVRPDVWDELSIDVKARMLRVWQLENMRTLKEQTEAVKSRGK